MVKPNFECAKCSLIASYSRQQMKDHIDSHRTENDLIRKELLLD